MSVIERHAWRAQPWKNGGGTTHEIWRTPDTDDYDVRVSLAEVTTSGPFSQFPGYRRYTFLVGPAPLVLHGETPIELVAVGDHVELPGETALSAELRAGATSLLNVLARVPILVGHGATPHAMRFVFDLAQQRAMSDVVGRAGCVWIA
jgi:environmental stress-induced protein Ves